MLSSSSGLSAVDRDVLAFGPQISTDVPRPAKSTDSISCKDIELSSSVSPKKASVAQIVAPKNARNWNMLKLGDKMPSMAIQPQNPVKVKVEKADGIALPAPVSLKL